MPGFHLWEPPGKPVSIHIALDVIDRMSQEVLRAFSAVPKRGAEIGGLLLGSASAGETLSVRIDDFEAIECEHRFGPSYILSKNDQEKFDESYLRFLAAEDKSAQVVGYFRSHTRDGMSLGPEDLELCRQLFSKPSDVVLLIKPFATRASMAGFLFLENGQFQPEPYVQFPFRRRDLAGEPAHGEDADEPRARRHGHGAGDGGERITVESSGDAEPARRRASAPLELERTSYEEPPSYPDRIYSVGPLAAEPGRSRYRSNWLWMPLSLIFLLLGVLLGFQAALTLGPRTAAGASQTGMTLGLAVTANDDNLHVNWDRQSPPIRSSTRGLLEITDGAYKKTINLNASQLQNGSVIYHHLAEAVVFRLTVYPSERVVVTEKYAWTKSE